MRRWLGELRGEGRPHACAKRGLLRQPPSAFDPDSRGLGRRAITAGGLGAHRATWPRGRPQPRAPGMMTFRGPRRRPPRPGQVRPFGRRRGAATGRKGGPQAVAAWGHVVHTENASGAAPRSMHQPAFKNSRVRSPDDTSFMLRTARACRRSPHLRVTPSELNPTPRQNTRH